MRCLHMPWGALGKSRHSHDPLTTKYVVVPLLWLATFALPSGSNSTSPLSTIAAAFSTLPLHSGNAALALSAISATASRQALRAGFSLLWVQVSLSQEYSATIVIAQFL